MKFRELFAVLRKKREFERLQLPFVRSLIDFDIVIEIGYAQEQKSTITLKQLSLLQLGSVTTVRRRLSKLIAQGIVVRRANANDHRSELLTLAAASLKTLERYGSMFFSVAEPIRHTSTK
jgi:DNA-binding MarR family transcriptional regulator